MLNAPQMARNDKCSSAFAILFTSNKTSHMYCFARKFPSQKRSIRYHISVTRIQTVQVEMHNEYIGAQISRDRLVVHQSSVTDQLGGLEHKFIKRMMRT